MHQVLSIIEREGLFTDDLAAERISKLTVRECDTLSEKLHRALLGTEPEHGTVSSGLSSAFQFLASSSLRGDAGCSRVPCHLKKVNNLARFAALYCDRVFFPVRVLPLGHRPRKERRQQALLLAVTSINALRPLVEAEIVSLVSGNPRMCMQCLCERVPNSASIVTTADQMGEDRAKLFSLTFLGVHGNGRHFFYVEGPENYIEHGSYIRVIQGRPKWLPEGVKPKTKLSLSVLKRSETVTNVFRDVAQDLLIQGFYNLQHHSNYLTDRPADAEFLTSLNKQDQLARASASICAKLTHNIPLLAELPLETLIRIRRDDALSFEQYRSAITQIANQYVVSGKKISDQEANDIYNDELSPKLIVLQRKAKTERRSVFKKAVVKGVANSAVIALGVMGGVLPAHVAQLVTAIGGVKTVADIGELIGSLEKNPLEVRNHDLYFLLRLKQEGEE